MSAGIPWEDEPRPEAAWINLHNSFVQNTLNNNGSIKVLFYGDSITAQWGSAGKPIFDQYYAPLGTANYGIGGDRTEHVLWRIKNGEVTERLNPVLCVIKVGTNNIGTNDDTSIARGVEANVLELRQRLPNMKILLLGVLPRSNEALTIRTSTINSIIQRLDNGRTIRYLDLKDHFYRGGNNFVTEFYNADLVHLTVAGYAKWAQVMDPLFREMLGSS